MSKKTVGILVLGMLLGAISLVAGILLSDVHFEIQFVPKHAQINKACESDL